MLHRGGLLNRDHRTWVRIVNGVQRGILGVLEGVASPLLSELEVSKTPTDIAL